MCWCRKLYTKPTRAARSLHHSKYTRRTTHARGTAHTAAHRRRVPELMSANPMISGSFAFDPAHINTGKLPSAGPSPRNGFETRVRIRTDSKHACGRVFQTLRSRTFSMPSVFQTTLVEGPAGSSFAVFICAGSKAKEPEMRSITQIPGTPCLVS